MLILIPVKGLLAETFFGHWKARRRCYVEFAIRAKTDSSYIYMIFSSYVNTLLEYGPEPSIFSFAEHIF